MKVLSFISIACIAVISCSKKATSSLTPSGKIKVSVRPVAIDEDNTRSETDVMWVNINK